MNAYIDYIYLYLPSNKHRYHYHCLFSSLSLSLSPSSPPFRPPLQCSCSLFGFLSLPSLLKIVRYFCPKNQITTAKRALFSGQKSPISNNLPIHSC